jgi:ABC-type ATPase involved in cell division
VIRFENVAKVYDETSLPALVDVTLDITRGEFIYLVGASGSGKSTFLQLVLREHKATSGQVLVAGKDIAALSSWKVPHLRRQMGAVFQDCRVRSAAVRTNCLAENSSGWPSLGPSSTGRPFCSPTSPPETSTRQRVWASCGCWN